MLLHYLVHILMGFAFLRMFFLYLTPIFSRLSFDRFKPMSCPQHLIHAHPLGLGRAVTVSQSWPSMAALFHIVTGHPRPFHFVLCRPLCITSCQIDCLSSNHRVFTPANKKDERSKNSMQLPSKILLISWKWYFYSRPINQNLITELYPAVKEYGKMQSFPGRACVGVKTEVLLLMKKRKCWKTLRDKLQSVLQRWTC